MVARAAKQTITADTWTRFGLPRPATEVRVCHDRLFRVDFVWHCQCAEVNSACDLGARRVLAVEVHGGTWVGGGHSRGTVQARDLTKGQFCALNGWYRMEFTPRQVTSGYAPAVVAAWLCGETRPALPPDPEDRRKGRTRAHGSPEAQNGAVRGERGVGQDPAGALTCGERRTER